jgi:MoxR-like ATPase
MSLPIQLNVEASACLPVPDHYAFPLFGQAYEDAIGALLAFKNNRSMYLHGLPGTGKDAFVHALCGMTRKPSKMYQVLPGLDMSAWFETRAFNVSGTFWEEGSLLKELRDGYTCPKTGNKFPYTILLTDLDRADKHQMEFLRLILDSIKGRIQSPSGRVYPLFPGTQIIATGNSMGAGDVRGRCSSSQMIDASIIDRFEFIREFHWMEWRDEKDILRHKFSYLYAKDPAFLDILGKCVVSIRKEIMQQGLYCELSHRALCAWAQYAEDMLKEGWKIRQITKEASRAFIDRLPDPDTQLKVQRLIEPFLKGGVLSNSSFPTEGELLDTVKRGGVSP